MQQFTKLQSKLLQLLADANCYSGNMLGKQLQVSRTTIWKNIRQLTNMGLDVNRLPHQGYQLSQPMLMLNEQAINNKLALLGYKQSFNFHLFAIIDSTNRFLKELPHTAALEICCAEKQTQGRGRFGRNWVSPFGENIYFSSRWQFNCCLSHLSGLSLVVSLAVITSLKDYAGIHQLQVKWPNDLLWQGKKLGGILIEIIAETNGYVQVVIGIGLNVNTATERQHLVDKPWCSLYEITKNLHDRNKLIAHLIYSLSAYINQFLHSGFAAFQQQWQQLDYLDGKTITVNQPAGLVIGTACGVNKLGQLQLQNDEGMHYLSTGDASLAKIIEGNC